MFKQLKNYYVVVSLPLVLLLAGSLYFYDAVRGTVVRNPHPQINFAIFYIILFGGALILLSAYRLMHEAKTIVNYSKLIRAKTPLSDLQKIVEGFTGDISYVLQMVVASTGRRISHQEQVAIEHELVNARARLIRRNALPQYLTGLLVGMGLLGTFVGLLATLSDISVLISSFAELDMATASPLVVFRTMIERMKAPMQSMSIAFSASMFGLLGSIILGLMMLGIRRMQGDISSLLSSLVARHIEIALAFEGASQESSQPAAIGGEKISSGNEYAVLLRIEERLAETARLQQRMLSAELEDFQKQRSDILQALSAQTEASNLFRSDLQHLVTQFGSLISMFEKSNGNISAQISELTIHANGAAKESQSLLVSQIEEQKKLRGTLDSYNIEERLAETARIQQRALTAEIDDFQKQRADMLRTLSEQNESSNALRSELQQLGRQLGSAFKSMEQGTREMSSQLSELTIHVTAEAKEAKTLLAMQVHEQKELRQILDWRGKNSLPESE